MRDGQLLESQEIDKMYINQYRVLPSLTPHTDGIFQRLLFKGDMT